MAKEVINVHFESDELQKIRESAKENGKIPSLNPDWKRAYLDLAYSADRIDAMIARTKVNISNWDNEK